MAGRNLLRCRHRRLKTNLDQKMTKSETDNPRALGESKAFTNTSEDILIWLLCFAAALHVFIFSARFRSSATLMSICISISSRSIRMQVPA